MSLFSNIDTLNKMIENLTYWFNEKICEGNEKDIILRLSDGYTIIELVEKILGTKISGITKNPRFAIQKASNTSLALSELQYRGYKVIVSADNLVLGHPKPVAGFLWNLFEQSEFSKNKKQTKEKLIRRCNDIVRKYGFSIKNFQTFMKTKALFAMVDALQPGSFPFDKLLVNKMDDVQAAIDFAFDHWQVPKCTSARFIFLGKFGNFLEIYLYFLLGAIARNEDARAKPETESNSASNSESPTVAKNDSHEPVETNEPVVAVREPVKEEQVETQAVEINQHEVFLSKPVKFVKAKSFIPLPDKARIEAEEKTDETPEPAANPPAVLKARLSIAFYFDDGRAGDANKLTASMVHSSGEERLLDAGRSDDGSHEVTVDIPAEQFLGFGGDFEVFMNSQRFAQSNFRLLVQTANAISRDSVDIDAQAVQEVQPAAENDSAAGADEIEVDDPVMETAFVGADGIEVDEPGMETAVVGSDAEPEKEADEIEVAEPEGEAEKEEKKTEPKLAKIGLVEAFGEIENDLEVNEIEKETEKDSEPAIDDDNEAENKFGMQSDLLSALKAAENDASD